LAPNGLSVMSVVRSLPGAKQTSAEEFGSV
jgi:hypothetical protein